MQLSYGCDERYCLFRTRLLRLSYCSFIFVQVVLFHFFFHYFWIFSLFFFSLIFLQLEISKFQTIPNVTKSNCLFVILEYIIITILEFFFVVGVDLLSKTRCKCTFHWKRIIILKLFVFLYFFDLFLASNTFSYFA